VALAAGQALEDLPRGTNRAGGVSAVSGDGDIALADREEPLLGLFAVDDVEAQRSPALCEQRLVPAGVEGIEECRGDVGHHVPPLSSTRTYIHARPAEARIPRMG